MMDMSYMGGGGVRDPTHGARPQVSRTSNGKQFPVFLFPGLSGDVQEFASLLSSKVEPIQFVPIVYPHWSQLERKPEELDRLIAHCVAQVQRIGLPAGALFVGYSFGGQMAWAVARDMAACGQQIGFLGLLDTPSCPDLGARAGSSVARLSRFIRGIQQGTTGEQLTRAVASFLIRPGSGRLLSAFRRLNDSALLNRLLRRIDIEIQMQYHIVLLLECINRMETDSKSGSYPAVLFRCINRTSLGFDATLGWSRHLADLRVISVPGDHASVIQLQNVPQIINELVAAISRDECLANGVA